MTMATPSRPHQALASNRSSSWPALAMGLGLGGFVDGIVLHEILQRHHMVSSTDGNPLTTLEGLKANTTADGFFHVGTWLLVLLGILGMLRLWRSGRPAPSGTSTLGLLLAGWGVFNLVEGVVDHMILACTTSETILGVRPPGTSGSWCSGPSCSRSGSRCTASGTARAPEPGVSRVPACS